jgi:hypothetical protein
MANEENIWLETDEVALLMGTPQGRRIVQKILDKCNIRTACENISDPYATAAREGARFIGLTLLEQLEVHQPKLLMLMYKETLNVDGTRNDTDGNTNNTGNREYGEGGDNGNPDGDREYGIPD